MRLIKPSFEIIEQSSDIEDVFKQIELAGRTCYKSEDKITPDSAKEFVERMIKSGHGAMLEHGTVYLGIEENANHEYSKYYTNKYSVIKEYNPNTQNGARGQMVLPRYYCITTNYRVLVENGWLDDLQYICDPSEHHEKRISVRFICDRGVSHEFVRHRVFSFAQESTRYCNYSKDKFGNELTFILPCWFAEDAVWRRLRPDLIEDLNKEEICYWTEEDQFLYSLNISEKMYTKLLSSGWTPQQARSVLPNSLKTELVMTGFVSDWKHFFKLRDSASAHPQARELAQPLHEEMKKMFKL